MGQGEYGHGGDVEALQHPGSLHQDGDHSQTGVEDDERRQDVGGEEITTARSLD